MNCCDVCGWRYEDHHLVNPTHEFVPQEDTTVKTVADDLKAALEAL